MNLSFTLNGSPIEISIEPDVLLLDLVRDLGLTGTKEGCGVGVCGLCSLLVDDVAVSSCLYLAACAEGTEIWTVEGLAREDPQLIQAFVDDEGMQCGICTPGQVVAVAALARQSPHATEAEIRDHQAGNLCRCTGYQTIGKAVRTYLANR